MAQVSCAIFHSGFDNLYQTVLVAWEEWQFSFSVRHKAKYVLKGNSERIMMHLHLGDGAAAKPQYSCVMTTVESTFGPSQAGHRLMGHNSAGPKRQS